MKPVGQSAELLGVGVGAGDVWAGDLAVVQARRARRAGMAVGRVAERPARIVVADQIGVRVLKHRERRVGQQCLGLPRCGDDAAETVVFFVGGVDQSPGGRSGDAFAVVQGVMDLAEVFGDRASGLQVEQSWTPPRWREL